MAHSHAPMVSSSPLAVAACPPGEASIVGVPLEGLRGLPAGRLVYLHIHAIHLEVLEGEEHVVDCTSMVHTAGSWVSQQHSYSYSLHDCMVA